jgi:hypothetical protein
MSSRPQFERIVAYQVCLALWWLIAAEIAGDVVWLGGLLALHAGLPFWASVSARSRSWAGFALGPGLTIAAYVVLLTRWANELRKGFPEATWISWMLWFACAIAAAAYALYSWIVTEALIRRRARKR